MADAEQPAPPAEGSAVIVAPPTAFDRRKAEPIWANQQFILALIVTVCLFGLLLVMAFHPAPPENHDLVNIMLTTVTAGWIAIVSYFYGSNQSSKSKDAAIATLAATTPAAPKEIKQ